MGNKILELIDIEISRQPKRAKKKEDRERQYVDAKKELCTMFPDYCEYICKAVAKRYGR